jgi:hypothetical protein
MDWKKSVLLAVAAGLSACATVQVPQEKFSQTQGTIRAADEVGASQVPNAKLMLQLARDQELQAKQLSDEGNPRAETVLGRAEIDAKLAIALSREAAARKEAERATDELNNLKKR